MTPAANTNAEAEPLIERLRRSTIGRYDLYAELGSGGMASVFLALDLALDRKVAIKVLSPELARAAENVTRFRREAKVAAALDHPNIIGILAVGDDPALAYFVMKYVEGSTLDAVITAEGPQSVPFVRGVLATTGRALQFAHQRGVIHRDVKPANLMLDLEGRLIITDFGIAKMEDAQGLTIPGSVIGTPHYMSPEQFNGLPVTGATDQYALGVVAYELLTGVQPYRGNTVGEVMRGHLFGSIPSVRSEQPEVPEALDAAISRMLAKRAEDRFATLDEAVRAIESGGAADEGMIRTQIIELARSGARQRPEIHLPISPAPAVRTRPMAAPTVVSEAPRRRRTLAIVAIVATALVLGGLGATAALRPGLLGIRAPNRGNPLATPRSLEPGDEKVGLEPPSPMPADSARVETARAATPSISSPTRRDPEPFAQPVAPAVTPATAPDPSPDPSPTTQGRVAIGSRILLAALYVNDAPPINARGLQRLVLPAGPVRLSIRSTRCPRWDTTFTVVAGTEHRIGFRPTSC